MHTHRMQKENRFLLLERWKIVQVHYLSCTTHPKTLLVGQMHSIRNELLFLSQLNKNQISRKVVNDIVVTLILKQMLLFYISILRSVIDCLILLPSNSLRKFILVLLTLGFGRLFFNKFAFRVNLRRLENSYWFPLIFVITRCSIYQRNIVLSWFSKLIWTKTTYRRKDDPSIYCEGNKLFSY